MFFLLLFFVFLSWDVGILINVFDLQGFVVLQILGRISASHHYGLFAIRHILKRHVLEVDFLFGRFFRSLILIVLRNAATGALL